MPFELLTLFLDLPRFMLVAARLAGLIMFQPVLTALAVPSLVRVVLILGLAALLTPLVAAPARVPDTVLGLVLLLGQELLFGSLLGATVAIVFAGVQMGGELIAQESGLSFGQMVDPATNQTVSVLSTFYTQLVAVVYLILGGHRALLGASLDTFTTIPLGTGVDVLGSGPELLLDVLAAGTGLAIRVAAPALLTLFLVNVSLGFISRTVPQIDIATMGFSLKALIGFTVMAMALPAMVAALTDTLDLSMEWLHRLVSG